MFVLFCFKSSRFVQHVKQLISSGDVCEEIEKERRGKLWEWEKNWSSLVFKCVQHFYFLLTEANKQKKTQKNTKVVV